MAVPGTVQTIVVRPGHNPGDVIVECDALVADPVVLTYTFFIDSQTGVTSSSFRGKRVTTVTRAVFRNKNWREVYATAIATNAEGSSASDATEASGNVRR